MTREVIRYDVQTGTYETLEEPDEMFPETVLMVPPISEAADDE